MLSLTPPPVQTSVDEAGVRLSFPWVRWFSSLFTALSALLGKLGGVNLQFPYCQFYSTVSQTASAATITSVTFNNTSYAVGFTISSSQLILSSNAGTYNVQYSLQLANTSASADDVTTWFRKNGVDVPASAGICSVIAKHGSVNGHTLMAANFLVDLAVGDNIQLMWTTDSGASLIEYTVPGVAPVHPSTPSAVITAQFASSP